MLQIIYNYLFVLIVPFIAGCGIRLLFRRMKRFYFVTGGLCALSAISYLAVSKMNTHGSEGPMITVFMLLCFTVGMITVGVIGLLIRAMKK